MKTWHREPELLSALDRAIERGGYALQEAQDETGMVIFRKKDHSTWGPIYMPWVYSRMVRAFYITKEAMGNEAQQRWSAALLLAYDGIARTPALFAKEGGTFDADYAAHMLLYGADGELTETASAQNEHTSRIGSDALVVRRRPWFYALSAFTAEIPQNRFGQDRQNFASIYHDDVGLIAGGGNTKLQPLWSSFTVGDTSLLYHAAGDEEPDITPRFTPRAGLLHVPDSAELVAGGSTVQLHYGETACRIELRVENDRELIIALAVTTPTLVPITAHITLIAHLNKALQSAVGHCDTLGEEALDWPDPHGSNTPAGGWTYQAAVDSTGRCTRITPIAKTAQLRYKKRG